MQIPLQNNYPLTPVTTKHAISLKRITYVLKKKQNEYYEIKKTV